MSTKKSKFGKTRKNEEAYFIGLNTSSWCGRFDF
jgi:hypothetical protein